MFHDNSKGSTSIVLQKKTLTPFIYAIVPKANKPKQKVEGLTIFAVERVEEAVEYCRVA